MCSVVKLYKVRKIRSVSGTQILIKVLIYFSTQIFCELRKFMSSRREPNTQPSDLWWDAQTIELPELRWQREGYDVYWFVRTTYTYYKIIECTAWYTVWLYKNMKNMKIIKIYTCFIVTATNLNNFCTFHLDILQRDKDKKKTYCDHKSRFSYILLYLWE